MSTGVSFFVMAVDMAMNFPVSGDAFNVGLFWSQCLGKMEPDLTSMALVPLGYAERAAPKDQGAHRINPERMDQASSI
jgi:hypothetical protein